MRLLELQKIGGVKKGIGRGSLILLVKFSPPRPAVILHPFWRTKSTFHAQPLFPLLLEVKFTPLCPAVILHSFWQSSSPHPAPPLLAANFTPPHPAVIFRPSCWRKGEKEGKWETGDERQETRDERRETGDGRREMGDGRRETGDGRRETGDGVTRGKMSGILPSIFLSRHPTTIHLFKIPDTMSHINFCLCVNDAGTR